MSDHTQNHFACGKDRLGYFKTLHPVRQIVGYSLLIMGTAACFKSAQAANDFTVNPDGTINSPCPVNYNCSGNSISVPGMLQRSVTDGTGRSFIQSIVVDVDQLHADTTISLQSLVSIGGDNGISASQTMEYVEGTDFLTSNAELNMGWANTSLQPGIVLNQAFSLTYLEVVNTDGSFTYEADLDTSDQVIGEYIDVTQRVENSSLLSATPTTGRDIQTAVYRRASGTRVPTSGSIVLPSARGMMGGMGGMMNQVGMGMMGNGTGGTGTWSPDDNVVIFWIGQVCDGCMGGGMMGGMGGGGMGGGGMGGGGGDVIFSYQLFDNLSDPLNPFSTLSITSSDPFDWDPVFGPQPTLE